ncbi:MAG: hypothetical protein JEZ07_16940 [Phycisphaerae bacterium]|nr:hypothetical protein [Phycisphaerae bacterium]
MHKFLIVLILFFTCLTGLAGFDKTEYYEIKQIQGWTIHVNKDLIAEDKLCSDTLELLGHRLFEVKRVLPEKALQEMQKVPFWVELKDKKPNSCACYHPSRQWLINNDYNPEKAKSVEISNAKNFLAWSKAQPYMVLHELAHAYHQQVAGHGNKQINDAYKKAVASKKYEKVLHINGRDQRHYGLNNDKEYFAEATEAYFGVNDFYPFVKSELKRHDPDAFAVIKEVWK